jgi:hypothetical protein
VKENAVEKEAPLWIWVLAKEFTANWPLASMALARFVDIAIIIIRNLSAHTKAALLSPTEHAQLPFTALARLMDIAIPTFRNPNAHPQEVPLSSTEHARPAVAAKWIAR